MGVMTPIQSNLRAAERQRLRAGSALPQGLVLACGDVLSLVLAFSVTTQFGGSSRSSLLSNTLLVWGSLWLIWRAYQGLYPGYGRSPQTQLRLHVVSTLQLAAVHLASSLTIRSGATDASSTLLSWIVLLIVSMPMRYALRAVLIHMGAFGRKISIIGGGRTASIAVSHLRNSRSFGLIPVAVYDDNPALHGMSLHGVPVLGPISDALTDPLTEQALISIPGARAQTQQRLVNSVYAVFPYTWVIPDLFGVPNQALLIHNIGSVASLEIRNNLGSVQSRFMKRSIDLLAASIGGLLILPVLLLIALAIKLDSPGPAVYRARRLGRNGKPFDCFKFRSMHQDAAEKLSSLLASDPELQAEFSATHKLKCDPRITRVGTFLRKTSLDELPQLANVLLGTMSLVGPRPIVEAEISKYGDIYTTYKQVRPGITGYWQANGRSDTSYDERVGMDNFYITNWSPWLDMVIMIQTVKVVVAGEGAY